MAERLNWEALVREARRRRAKEGLTQLKHAQLAGVSRDTIRSFDRAERSISIDKATAILRVVGLVDAEGEASSKRHSDFVRRAYESWDRLVRSLTEDHPARFPQGRVAYDYELHGVLKFVTIPDIERLLENIEPISGWPPFHVFSKDSLRPAEADDGEIECWIGRPDGSKVFTDPAESDYWRVSTRGDFFLLRGLDEDGSDSDEPGTFLDVSLPIWRAADVVEHAWLIADDFPGQAEEVTLQASWEGLEGRRLVNWSRPTTIFLGRSEYRSRLSSVRSMATLRLAEERSNAILDATARLIQPLYTAFSFDRSRDAVVTDLERRRVKYRALRGGRD